MKAAAGAPKTIAPPSKLLLALEARAAAWPVALLAAPRGKRQPVLVLPGLGATDRSTAALRFYLDRLGYEAHGWGLGRNVRPAGADIPAVVREIRRLRAASATPVTLVGWSRGGMIAREAARVAPDDIRMVITLGSPVAGVSATNAGRAWRRLTGEALPTRSPAEIAALAAPLPVPMTSIYSRGDGVVAWRACLVAEGPTAENVEVRGSHLGLGFNPAALWVVADRLAQSPGTWKPFRPSGLAARFFPAPTNAATTGRRG